MGVTVVLGVFFGVWLASQALIAGLVAAAVAYLVVMHCPPYDLVGDLLRRRRARSERWVAVSRRTVLDRAI